MQMKKTHEQCIYSLILEVELHMLASFPLLNPNREIFKGNRERKKSKFLSG